MTYDYLIKFVKSPAALYVILRYFTYGLQFLNSILLVNVLGDYAYGIYGFILMFSVYAIYLNLGLNESLNAEYAINKSDKAITSQLWNSTLYFIIIWYCLITIIALLIKHCVPGTFSKYEFDSYGNLLIITCALHNISTIFATLYKIHGKILKVNIQQLIPQVGVLLVVLMGKHIASIDVIVVALFITDLISLIVFAISPPEKIKFKLNFRLIIILLKRGVSLLFYNLSFQLLTMLALAVVSYMYTVEQMGCYSLANSITNGVIMAGGAFLYIFSPKIINKMGVSSAVCKSLIGKFEQVYNVFIDFISVLSMVFVWGLSYAYPNYGSLFVKIYTILIIGRIINNASTGYSTYLIAIKMEFKLVLCGLISLLFACVCYVIIGLYSCSMDVLPLAIVLASILFSSMVIIVGQLELHGSVKWQEFVRLLFGQNKWIIFIIGIGYSYFYTNPYVLIIGLLMYLSLNWKNIFISAGIGYRIVSNKYALNF